ncbi:MAG TPA: S8 family serine peptidase [Blastocatellia bacterium]|jgi:hypothetical protein|nr:S8 family serine peptidase [Blastocatellia bacterium]
MKKGFVLSFITVASFLLSAVVGADIRSLALKKDVEGRRDKSGASRAFAAGRSVGPETYRSPGALRKVVISADDKESLAFAMSSEAVELEDYGSFKLFAITQAALDRMGASGGRGEGSLAPALESLNRSADGSSSNELHAVPSPVVRDDLNVLLLRSGAIDTTAGDAPGRFLGLGRAAAGRGAGLKDASQEGAKFEGTRLRLVQFVGPVKREWLDGLRAGGVEPIAYVPNNAYLVRAGYSATERFLKASRGGGDFIQWEGPFIDEYKIHPGLRPLMNEEEGGDVTVAVQLARGREGSGSEADLEAAKRLASSLVGDSYEVLDFTNLKMRVRARRIKELAALGNVVNIEPWTAPELYDERSSQIVAGELSADGKQARGPGYLAWLQAHGFASGFNFAIDITDTGMDRGSTAPDRLHPDFLDASGQSRVVYARDYTSELDAGDAGGHGTINMSIAGGANVSASARDSSGFNYGLGVAPFARLGSSRIFQSTGRFDLVEPYTKLISEAYRDGARISSNSWGSGTNEYTIDSQEYDSRVRDALPGQAGNQEMVIVFAAGNAGPGGRIGSPGTGKNVISVAASESFRKGGSDGCGVEDLDADSALDIAFFSSGGSVNDGRLKPDLAAPGTHIQGAASQHPDFVGEGICGEDIGKPYFPAGQTLYTWSSGTSHATPAVAGAAALVRQHFLSRGQEPSPALVKALLVNTTTYMTGELAAGDLPHPRQGWGLMNTGRAFDSQSKIFVDQTNVLSESGQEFVLTGSVTDPTQPFRVTLAWTDAPGLSSLAPWVNDLDLQVVIDGKVYVANDFSGNVSQSAATPPNTKDNIESVWLPAGTSGTFVVRVRASNIAGDAIPGNGDATDQDFALVVYNAERKDVPVAIRTGGTLTAGGDSFVDPGETASMSISLGNASPFALTGGKATLTSSTQGVTVGTGSVDVPDIPGGASRDVPAPFTFTVGGSVACGTVIQLSLEVGGQGFVSRLPMTVRVGSATPVTVLQDDIDSGAAAWTHGSSIKKKKNRIDTWVISERRSRSGSKSWFTPNLGKQTDAFLDTAPLAIPADAKDVRLTFFHTFEFEPGGFDGGVIEISTGGGFEDLGQHIVKGRYNGALLSFGDNTLKGRPGWISGRHGEFQPVVIDLSSFAGKTVTIRFRIGTDSTVKGLGWYVDDVRLDGVRVRCGP